MVVSAGTKCPYHCKVHNKAFKIELKQLVRLRFATRFSPLNAVLGLKAEYGI
jgi:hypothetical protein